MDVLAVSLRAAYPPALATLIRLPGDVYSAEDALREALVRALEGWPEKGLPDNPVAWLVATVRNHAIDLLRKHNMESRYALSSGPEVNDVIRLFPKRPRSR